jgi:hypothetical protein
MKKIYIILIFAFFILLKPALASAHQPRLVESNIVEVKNPEVSQAFYGELKGTPTEFRIQSDIDFRLYVGILVPDTSNIRKDISAEIFRSGQSGEQSIALLDGAKFAWIPFYEEFGMDNYFWGPEFKANNSQRGVDIKGRNVQAGTYIIKVFSPGNQGKYSLAIGDIEVFPPREILNTILIMPQLKAHFFGYSFFHILASPYIWGYILLLYIMAFLSGFIYRFLLRKFANSAARIRPKNIGLNDRLIRAVLGLALLIWAVSTTWNPLLIFISGFCFFEAIFSWCGLYAALGKNSCPL